jgi:hypothetical protein
VFGGRGAGFIWPTVDLPPKGDLISLCLQLFRHGPESQKHVHPLIEWPMNPYLKGKCTTTFTHSGGSVALAINSKSFT